MKVRLALAFLVLGVALSLLPALTIHEGLAEATAAAVTPQQCAAFCARVRCIGGQVCGLFTNSQGQTVCGCHPR